MVRDVRKEGRAQRMREFKTRVVMKRGLPGENLWVLIGTSHQGGPGPCCTLDWI